MDQQNQIQEINYPDIFIYNEENPTLLSPNSSFEVPFAQTRETLLDVEVYKHFLENAIRRFRTGKTYKHYKAHLMGDLGLNRCQYHSNIRSSEEGEMATVEMHHHVLTIFDIALIITEHILNTYKAITTFDLVELMKLEHTEHRVCTVSLCKTCHQLYHNDPLFYISSRMGFGNWFEFLSRYRTGITRDIAMKIMLMMKRELEDNENKEKNTLQLLSIRDNIMNWSEYNERFFS
jgi:hypothetical protein